MYKKELKPTLKNVTRMLTADDIYTAERFWILESQSSMEKDILLGGSALANEMTEFTLWGTC